MSREYRYVDLTEKGYSKTKMSLRKLNGMGIAYRGRGLIIYAEVFYKEGESIVVEYYGKPWAKCAILILSPLIYLIGGVTNYKEITRDLKRELWQKKYGSYTSDVIMRRSGTLYNTLTKELDKK